MAINNSIDFLICNYNCEDVIIDCIKSILNLGSKNINILIYDNKSSDNSINQIKSLNNRSIILFEGNENIGYGKAINILAKKSNANFIFILNPDTVLKFKLNDLHELLNNIYSNNIIWGFNIIGKTGLIQNFTNKLPGLFWLIGSLLRKSMPGIINPFYNLFYSISRTKYNIADMQLVPGCGLLMNKDIFIKIGMFNPSYFLYFEDTELLLKAHQQGVKISKSSLTIIHDSSFSFKKSKNKIKIEEFKSALIFFKNNYSYSYFIIAKILLKSICLISFTNPYNYFNKKYKYFYLLFKI
jgi:GT2 family glycosyltransferase